MSDTGVKPIQTSSSKQSWNPPIQQAVNWFEGDTVHAPKYCFHTWRIFHSTSEKDALYRISEGWSSSSFCSWCKTFSGWNVGRKMCSTVAGLNSARLFSMGTSEKRIIMRRFGWIEKQNPWRNQVNLYLMFLLIFRKVRLSWWWPLSSLVVNELIWNKT